MIAWSLGFGFSSECRTVAAMKAEFAELHRDEVVPLSYDPHFPDCGVFRFVAY